MSATDIQPGATTRSMPPEASSSPARSGLARSTFETLVTTLLILALGLANAVLLSRLLGPEGRGEIAAVMLWPMLLVAFGSFGLLPAVLFHSGNKAASGGAIVGTAWVISLAQSALVGLGGYLALPWLLRTQSAEVVAASRAFLLIVPISLVTQYTFSWIQASLNLRIYNLLRLFNPAGYLAGTVLLHWAGRLTLWNLVWLQLALNAVLGIAAVVTVMREEAFGRPRFVSEVARKLLSYGSKVTVGEISQGVNVKLDQMLMASWLTAADLGLYVVAVSASNPAQLLGTALRMSTTPGLVAAPKAARHALLAGLFRRFVLASLGLALVMGALMPWLLPLAFGAQFAGASRPAQILVVAAIIAGGKDLLIGALWAFGVPWSASRVELWSIGVTVVLLAIFLPWLGILGAAIASALTYTVQWVMVIVAVQRETGGRWRDLLEFRRSDWAFLWRRG